MMDAERARVLASSLAADGYQMEVAEAGVRVRVTITASPQACADCLVPQDLMRGILSQAFGVPPDAIDLTYPSTSETSSTPSTSETHPSTSEQER